NQLFRPLLLNGRTVQAVRSANVRRQILSEVAAEAGSPLKTHNSGAAAEPELPRRSILAAVEDTPSASSGPKTALGKSFYQEAEGLASRSPAFTENLRLSTKAFKMPAQQSGIA